jgi:hypothetical protein
MRKRVISLRLVVFLLVMVIPVAVYAVFINFDDVADEAVINNTYASRGVTFTSSCSGCHPPPNDAFALNSSIARSGPNVVSVFPTTEFYNPTGAFDEDFGGIITAAFSCRPTQVSIWAIPYDPPASAFLRAYDSGDNQIDAYVSAGTSSELLTVNAPTGQYIAYVTFAGVDGDESAFDDLTFTGGACDGAVAVPAMTEWGMILFTILAGFIAVYYMGRQRKAER